MLVSNAGDPIAAKLYCRNYYSGEADVFYLGSDSSRVTIVETTFECDSGILRLLILKGRVEPDTNGRIFVDEKVQIETPFESGDYCAISSSAAAN